MKKYKIIIIGAGPAGMMAAYAAKQHTDSILIIEKNEKTGKKLYITGKGRCNITSSVDISEYFENITSNPNFMYSSLYGFTNLDLMDFFNKQNLSLKEERGNRIFPESDKSSDVINALNKANKGIEISLNTTVKDVNASKEGFIVTCSNGTFLTEKLIVATGGLSYPTTGSTGDGYRFAKTFNHSIVTPKPSLCPLTTNDINLELVSGITVKNAKISVFIEGKKKKEEFGDFLFTHRGISGPIILTLSDFITEYDPKKVEMYCNFKPAIPEKELDERLLIDISTNPKKDLLSLLSGYFPKNLAQFLLLNNDLDEKMKVHEINKEIRQKIKSLITNYKFKYKSVDDIKYAIITKGGIDVKEINPQSMESNIVKNLFFCGEVIDVNAYTGGFNLQIAFSTGYLAGKSAGEKEI